MTYGTIYISMAIYMYELFHIGSPNPYNHLKMHKPSCFVVL